ncbi:hypothetical protein KEJ47_08830 [Candidatus Bathyarchaeota archaeon]|nr:hypothetical protein [Candidatus Bathyarchaeota archaeon]
MKYNNRLDLTSNLNPAATNERIIQRGEVEACDISEKNILCFDLIRPSDVKVQITPNGFIRLYFRGGSNLATAYEWLYEHGGPKAVELPIFGPIR